jgi:hypothetical protein
MTAPVRKSTNKELRRVMLNYASLREVVEQFTVEEQPFVEFESDEPIGGTMSAVLYEPEPEEEFNKRVVAYQKKLLLEKP